MFRGHCVGGTTTINTKVALRPSAQDYEKWHAAAGLLGDRGEPFAETDLLAHIERVELRLGVRERTDWQQCVHTVEPGFQRARSRARAGHVLHGRQLHEVRRRACRAARPTRASRRSTPTSTRRGRPDGSSYAPDAAVGRVVIEDSGDGRPRATGVEYVDGAGERHAVDAGAVVVAAGAMATSQLLIRSGAREARRRSPERAS